MLQCRTTPHTTTKVPPAEVLFSRVFNGKLPALLKETVKNRSKEAQTVSNIAKSTINNMRTTEGMQKDTNVKIGDHVVVTQDRENKLASSFNDKP